MLEDRSNCEHLNRLQDDDMFSPKFGGGYGSGGYGFAGGVTHVLPPPGRCTLAQHPAALPGTAAYHQVGCQVSPTTGVAGHRLLWRCRRSHVTAL